MHGINLAEVLVGGVGVGRGQELLAAVARSRHLEVVPA